MKSCYASAEKHKMTTRARICIQTRTTKADQKGNKIHGYRHIGYDTNKDRVINVSPNPVPGILTSFRLPPAGMSPPCG